MGAPHVDKTGTEVVLNENFYIKKRQAKKLDELREKYNTSVFEGKTKKAEKAEKNFAEYAQKLGVTFTDVKKTIYNTDEVAVPALVTKKDELSKEARREIEDLEKGIRKADKELAKYTDAFWHDIKIAQEKGQELTEEQKDALYKTNAKELLLKDYDKRRKELGIPTLNEIRAQLLKYSDPVEGEKMIKKIKKELKDANMYFGNIEAYIKSEKFEDLADAQAIDNKRFNTLAKGYTGVRGKETRELINGRHFNPVNVSIWAAEAFGTDLTGNRKGNEIKRFQMTLNLKGFNDSYVENNKRMFINDLPDTVKINGKEIKKEDITRLTLISGAQVTPNDKRFNSVTLGEIETIETKDGTKTLTGAVYYSKEDPEYISEAQTKKIAKSLGYDVEKFNPVKPVAEALGMGAATGLTALLSKHVNIIDDTFRFSITAENGKLNSEFIKGMLEKIQDKITQQGGQINILDGDVVGFEYINRYYNKNTHYCVAPGVVATAITLLKGLYDEAQKGEQMVAEDAFNAALLKLTDEEINNLAGGRGYTLNEKELNIGLEQLNAYLAALAKAPAPVQEAAPVQEIVADKPIELQAEVKTFKAEAKDCKYPRKPVESWSTIALGYYNETTGEQVTTKDKNYRAIYEAMRAYNKGQATNGGMPVEMKVQKELTINGTTYTFKWCDGCPKEEYQKVLDAEKAARAAKADLPKYGTYKTNVDMDSTKEQVGYVLKQDKRDANGETVYKTMWRTFTDWASFNKSYANETGKIEAEGVLINGKGNSPESVTKEEYNNIFSSGNRDRETKAEEVLPPIKKD